MTGLRRKTWVRIHIIRKPGKKHTQDVAQSTLCFHKCFPHCMVASTKKSSVWSQIIFFFFFLINIKELSILIQTRIHFSLSTLSSYGRLTEESNSALINNKDIKITNIYIGMEITIQNYTNVYVHVHPNSNW